MGHIKKVFFFPDAAKEEVRAELGAFQGTVNYVGMLGTERTTVPYLDAPLDAELAARLIQTLSTPETEYVVVLRNDHQPKAMLEYLQQRQMAFATKQEVLTYPSSVIYLAALGKQVHSKKYFVIFRTRSIEDVRWTISKFGSLDRVRLFITKAEVAPQVADLLAQDSSQIDYGRLLGLAEFHTLFDYDWEYFFVLTRKPHINHIVSWFRHTCHQVGVETETSTEPRTIANLRGRLERLTGIPLFHPLVSNSPVV